MLRNEKQTSGKKFIKNERIEKEKEKRKERKEKRGYKQEWPRDEI